MSSDKRYRVLFIDDDKILLRALHNYFTKLGHEVITAETGREGLVAYDEHKPDVSVVDLNLPDISGMDVLAELRRKNAMALMLTGLGQIENAVEAMRLHAENFLTKPIEMSHLAVAVEKAAEKAALRQENVELQARLSPTFKRVALKVGMFVLLGIVSAAIGIAIGSEGTEDPRTRAPIPVLPDSNISR